MVIFQTDTAASEHGVDMGKNSDMLGGRTRVIKVLIILALLEVGEWSPKTYTNHRFPTQ